MFLLSISLVWYVQFLGLFSSEFFYKFHHYCCCVFCGWAELHLGIRSTLTPHLLQVGGDSLGPQVRESPLILEKQIGFFPKFLLNGNQRNPPAEVLQANPWFTFPQSSDLMRQETPWSRTWSPRQKTWLWIPAPPHPSLAVFPRPTRCCTCFLIRILSVSLMWHRYLSVLLQIQIHHHYKGADHLNCILPLPPLYSFLCCYSHSDLKSHSAKNDFWKHLSFAHWSVSLAGVGNRPH